MPSGVYIRTEEHKRKMRETWWKNREAWRKKREAGYVSPLKGRPKLEEHIRKVADSNRGKKRTEEQNQKNSESHKGQIPWNKGLKTGPQSEETIAKRREANLRAYSTGEPQKKQSLALKGRRLGPHSEEHKQNIRIGVNKAYATGEPQKKQSEAANLRWLNPEERKKIGDKSRGKKLGLQSEETCRKKSLAQKALWRNSDYKRKQLQAIFEGLKLRPNGPELKFNLWLQEKFPGEFIYCGDGSVLIGYKNPDWINCNGKKLLIELFGDYWHGYKVTGRTKEAEEWGRIKHFAGYGFKTFILWEHELVDKKQVIEKVKNFMRGVE